MTKQVQRRRGTSTQHTSFTGAEGEISVNTTNKSIHVHDGVTAGGVEAARADLTNVSDANLNAALSGNTLSSLTITSVDINGGTIDGTVIGGASAAAGTFTTVTASGDVTIADKIVHSGDTNTSIRFPAADTVTVETSGAERLRITSTGNVGIGTTAPAAGSRLSVYSTASTDDDDLIALGFATFTPHASIGTHNQDGNNGGIKFSTKGASTLAERMRIDSNGRVGIGTTSMTYPLDVRDAAGATINVQTASGNAAVRIASTASGTPRLDLVSSPGTQSIYGGVGSVNNMVFYVNATERMRIDSSGNVGIGTSGPAEPLHVVGTVRSDVSSTGDFNFTAVSTGGGQYRIYPDDATTANPTWLHQSNSSEDQAWVIGGVERMRIDSSGNVGIGTSSPTVPLTVKAASSSSTAAKFLARGDGSVDIIFRDSSDTTSRAVFYQNNSSLIIGNLLNAPLTFLTNNTERMRIDSSGNVGIGTSNPAGWRMRLEKGDAQHLLLFNSAGNGTRINMADQSWQGEIEQTAGNLLFKTGGTTERLRITSAGNVGIGTSTPTFTVGAGLEISQSVGAVLRLTDPDNTGSFDLQKAGNEAYVYQRSNAAMIFGTNSTERMRIDSSGNLLVGTTNNSGIVTGSSVNTGFVAESGGTFYNQVNAGPNSYMSKASGFTNGEMFSFWVNNSQVGSITVTASATAYNTSSDYRLKENVQPMTGASDRVLSLNPVNFAWKADGTRTDGFIAHEVQEVAPYAVTGEKDGEEMQAIDHSKLVPLLTAALQEALKRIEALEAQLNP